jgi:hypothetical protein
MKSGKVKKRLPSPKKYAPKLTLAPMSFDQAIDALLLAKPKKKSPAKKERT